MNIIQDILENITNAYANPVVGGGKVILSVLLMVLVLSVYEFIVYRVVSHRAFYNRSFHICIAVLPFFISTIIFSLQSNIVITLGTIGALAILRFRTAIKDPVDMLYLMWSVHIGIICGCQLYELAVLTSLMVTVVLLCFEHIHIGRKPFVLVLHCDAGKESDVTDRIAEHTSKYRIKSRNYVKDSLDMVIELSVKDPQRLAADLREAGVERSSIIEYDSEDIL